MQHSSETKRIKYKWAMIGLCLGLVAAPLSTIIYVAAMSGKWAVVFWPVGIVMYLHYYPLELIVDPRKVSTSSAYLVLGLFWGVLYGTFGAAIDAVILA